MSLTTPLAPSPTPQESAPLGYIFLPLPAVLKFRENTATPSLLPKIRSGFQGGFNFAHQNTLKTVRLGQSCKNQSCNDGKLEEKNKTKQN